MPLFDLDDSGVVRTRLMGSAGRRILCRSPEMESLIRAEVAKLVSDHVAGSNQLDGLIYMAGWKETQFVPLYIGKAETTGRGGDALSANLKNLERDTSKFARWGDGYSYHIGDLSACVLPGHEPRHQQDKYRDWASTMFESSPAETPKLRRQVWFWAKAWNNQTLGIWTELGPTRLAFLEYTLIGVASMASPMLLNREGRQRR